MNIKEEETGIGIIIIMTIGNAENTEIICGLTVQTTQGAEAGAEQITDRKITKQKDKETIVVRENAF